MFTVWHHFIEFVCECCGYNCVNKYVDSVTLVSWVRIYIFDR